MPSPPPESLAADAVLLVSYSPPSKRKRGAAEKDLSSDVDWILANSFGPSLPVDRSNRSGFMPWDLFSAGELASMAC
jgi:hypothetical protein